MLFCYLKARENASRGTTPHADTWSCFCYSRPSKQSPPPPHPTLIIIDACGQRGYSARLHPLISPSTPDNQAMDSVPSPPGGGGLNTCHHMGSTLMWNSRLGGGGCCCAAEVVFLQRNMNCAFQAKPLNFSSVRQTFYHSAAYFFPPFI